MQLKLVQIWKLTTICWCIVTHGGIGQEIFRALGSSGLEDIREGEDFKNEQDLTNDGMANLYELGLINLAFLLLYYQHLSIFVDEALAEEKICDNSVNECCSLTFLAN